MTPEPIALVMAAGHGTRMRSSLPKVLHPVCGRPMIGWVMDAARAGGAGRIVCVTRPGAGLESMLPDDVELVEQRSGEGTGAAVLAARAALESAGREAEIAVLSGDHPLIPGELVAKLVATHRREGAAATILTTDRLDPAGYGRVVRAADGGVERLVETKHPERVTPEELALREINLGTYVFGAGELLEALDAVPETDGERYLTGVFPVLRERGAKVITHRTDDTRTALGVNTRADLIEVERQARCDLVERHSLAGVSFAAPETVVLDVGVEIGEDTRIEQGVTLRGATRVGRACTIGPHSTIVSSALGDEVTAPHSYLVESQIGDGAAIGPFAYLRPGSRVEQGAKVGTFVEVKNARIGSGAKVPHLSYVGDADVGEGANLGAGNITANYDGRRKHRTEIGRNVRTGVDTSFVAPVHVGDEAYTAAGSVIVHDVPDGALGVARARQRNIEGYAERVKKEEEPE